MEPFHYLLFCYVHAKLQNPAQNIPPKDILIPTLMGNEHTNTNYVVRTYNDLGDQSMMVAQ